MTLVIHLLRQFANGVGLLLAVLVLNFCLIHLAPGDPVQVIAGEMGGASAESSHPFAQNTGSITLCSSNC